MADFTSTLSNPGDINVIRAEIQSHDGKLLDISGIIGDITLYEDLFSNTMSGYLLLIDALDIVATLPLIGQELFYLEVGTPSLTKTIKKIFYIYKLHSRTSITRSQTYMLNFCSLELISSINSKVSKSFSGKISNTIASIFKDDRYLSSESSLLIEPTSNSLSFIAPYWTPFETINWLSNKSLSSTGASNFLFYETNQTYEYASVDLLMKAQHIREYTFADGDANTHFAANTNMIDEKFNIIESIDVPTVFDYMRSVSSGMYASTLFTVDTTTKSIRKSSFDYIDDFDKTSHLNPEPIRTSTLLRKKLSSIYFLAKNNYLNGKNQPLEYSKFFGQRHSLLEQLHAFKYSIKVFGRTDIKVGDVIKIKMQELRQITKEEIDGDGISKYYSGRYIISAIRHQIINGKHKMEMEVVKESFVENIQNMVK